MSETFRLCALVPSYDNPRTVGGVVRGLRGHGLPVIAVDDGSGEAGRRAIEALASDPGVQVVRRAHNGGKGAAVKTGFEAAADTGYSHALQIDADGQHDLTDVPRFVAAAREHPGALILGVPVFDESVPRGRAFARGISTWWVNREVGAGVIADPQCGFRVYPVAAARAAAARGDHMQFDQELPVRMVWRGVPVVNLETAVRYVPAAEGGVSHFQLGRDNLRISGMHARLSLQAPWRRWRRRRAAARAETPSGAAGVSAAER